LYAIGGKVKGEAWKERSGGMLECGPAVDLGLVVARGVEHDGAGFS